MYDELNGHLQGSSPPQFPIAACEANFVAEKRIKILKWLSQVEYEKHHRNAMEDLLENTGQWLLEKKQYKEWRSSSASGILWLHGIRMSIPYMFIDGLNCGWSNTCAVI